MKLLVLAQTPPPVHGQSLMVRTLLEGLPAQGIPLHHVELRLSHDSADIGRWRLEKIATTLMAALTTITARFRHGCDTLYYIPAPGKRGALYRDWLVLALCRPFFRKLVLHWHAAGLADWLEKSATGCERRVSRWLLGRADLSLVLAEALRGDAVYFGASRVRVVPNGIADPAAETMRGSEGAGLDRRIRPRPELAHGAPCRVLFLGLCSRAKGVFDAMEGVARANQRAQAAGGAAATFELTVAGGFASAAEEAEFQARAAQLGGAVRHVGFADETRKHALLAAADVFCFPTAYPHEGQPLVLLEALAHDLPIVTTRWRAIPELVPSEHVWLVEPGAPEAIAEALLAARAAAGRADGARRRHYLAHFTRERHLVALAAALRELERPCQPAR